VAGEFTPNASEPRPYPLRGKPGIRRDGTGFDSDTFIDGLWVRFNNFGRPRKMAGYRLVTDLVKGPARGIHVNPLSSYNRVHIGRPDGLGVLAVSSDGSIAQGLVDRTPVGFEPYSSNRWTFDLIYDAFGAGASRILAIACPNNTAVDNITATHLWYGDATATTPLIDTGAPIASGGVVVLHPFVFVYGNDGRLAWCDASLPNTWTGGFSGTARVTGAKLVKGLQMRGGNETSPAGLFWSLDSLIRCVFNPAAGGTQPTFKFDTVSTDISIIGQDAVVDYDGSFYWLGEDRFYLYNGVVQELPNPYNKQSLFDNLTYSARMTSYAYTIPRWGEVHFCVPLGGAPAPNWDFIYNVPLKVWYDTPLPESGRSCAHPAHVFPYPLMVGNIDTSGNNDYELWQHEIGFNRIYGSQQTAIRSYITHAPISYASTGPGGDNWIGVERNIHLDRIMLDMRQFGDMSMSVIYQDSPRGEQNTKRQVFQPGVKRLDDIRGQGMIATLTFESNVINGFFEHGLNTMYLRPGDVRPVGV
jgi:hypothetical protein